MIKVNHLHKKYRKKVAVDDISFTVATGKVTGFLGPNGAGKSTTMRIMLGLDGGGGIVTYDGKKLHEYAQPARIVGQLLEAKAFHPTRSARNHLRILTAAAGLPDSRVDEVLELVGLSEVAKQKPGKFSLGMSQRLGIAAAILGQPKYLLLDEPANGLDPEGIAWLRRFITDYAHSGNGVLISSHLLSEIALMADNLVVIGKGRLISETSTDALVNGNGQAYVRVKATSMAKLKKLLKTAALTFQEVDGALLVRGTTPEQVGKLAGKEGVVITELAMHRNSLEDAFLRLTEDSQEYRTHEGDRS
jgi:ABC-2 type transport system ATP-binding protein